MPPRRAANTLAKMAMEALRRQDGQMLPLIVVVLFAIVAVGVLTVQIGRAAVLRSDAQTAADAAALAAVRNIRDQLAAMVARTGTSSFELIDDRAVYAAAAAYAARNHAHLTGGPQRSGADVRVWVATEKTQGPDAPSGQEDSRGRARARARLELSPIFSSGGGGGGAPTGHDTTITDAEWDALERRLKHRPPRCTDDPADNDVYILGRFLQRHGGQTHENRELGDEPETDVGHAANSEHFHCNWSGAIDLTFPGAAGGQDAILDALQPKLTALGFRTFWRVPDHFDHMHVDTGAGVGGTGGATGPLVDSVMDVRLVDWDAPAITGYGAGFVGGAGGIPFGDPDPQVAAVACEVLHSLGVAGTARVALWEAMIQESGVHNLPYGDGTSVGVLQETDIHGSVEKRMNVPLAIRTFLVAGFTGAGGAISLARNNPGMSAGWVAQEVQGSAYGERYDPHQRQAIALNQRFCGGEGL